MITEDFFKDLEDKKKKIAVVGLGYVGIPLLLSLGKYFQMIGFDIDENKINNIKNGHNLEDILGNNDIDGNSCLLSSDEKILEDASFFIIAVPTPIDKHNDPDISLVSDATRIVGRNMPKNSIIVYESTVYPGLTEELCIPLLEEESGYLNIKDFCVGYSPERINPGDKIHTLENIVKVVSAQDEYSLKVVEKVYATIIKAGIYKAESIRVAEAAKVIENIQRDINIALVNELAIIFSKMNIDSDQVFKAAGTKWNFLDFRPGFVGGHCIGVDPFYLTYKARELGYNPEVILAGRRINDNMSYFVGNEILKKIWSNSDNTGKIKIIIFGITFKENIKDIRNSKIIDLYKYFLEFGIVAEIYDPVADSAEVLREYGIKTIDFQDISDIDAAVFCVAHDCFRKIDFLSFKDNFRNKNPYIFDIKGIFDKKLLGEKGYKYWRL